MHHRDINLLWELSPMLLQAICQGKLKELTALRVKLGRHHVLELIFSANLNSNHLHFYHYYHKSNLLA